MAYDYARQLSEGNAECKAVMDGALSVLISGVVYVMYMHGCSHYNV